ncbi:hypothetical protein TRFO_07209 [Tritrichomonas foetus]|uniref:Initiator binding domain-containing protein n=1 Tax=Tritrichomonas foetus TaxID=1144522 RepID=A0A1J4JV85_9EUKA|nr:hypothetical protein TRFO_07209 [Tritrichomonas foetus]|eukprot:OHT02352.1 hypothetical protein TRFO_07209 [Tritrichomonas foetus]
MNFVRSNIVQIEQPPVQQTSNQPMNYNNANQFQNFNNPNNNFNNNLQRFHITSDIPINIAQEAPEVNPAIPIAFEAPIVAPIPSNDNQEEQNNDNVQGLPDDLKAIISHRSTRNEKSRFPHKLFSLLQWAGFDEHRSRIAGCGWVNNDEFFLDKNVLCENMEIKKNTLNVNLKSLGFVQVRNHDKSRSYYRNDSFKKESTEEDFEKIRKTTNVDLFIYRAIHMPLLEDIELYGMDMEEIRLFKKEVIKKWESLVGKVVFAIGFIDFMKLLKANLQNHIFSDLAIIKQTLYPRNIGIIDIFDFAVFLARFGPFENVQLKLYQYQTILNELRPDLFASGSPSVISFFGPNFHNCFSFRHPHSGEYHCYNLPLKNLNEEFLVDEDGLRFPNWQKVIQMNPFLVHMRM